MHIHSQTSEPDRKAACFSGATMRRLIMLFGLAIFCGAAGTGQGAEVRFKDYEVKAGFLNNFTKYVEWPTNRFHAPNAPFIVAVAGNSPCKAELELIARERNPQGRGLIIKTVTTPEAAQEAHVLFISASEDSRMKEWLNAVQGRSVLTVGESELFGKQGGMILFLLEGEKIRFELNMDQATAAGLRVSAQLQKVAKSVRRK